MLAHYLLIEAFLLINEINLAEEAHIVFQMEIDNFKKKNQEHYMSLMMKANLTQDKSLKEKLNTQEKNNINAANKLFGLITRKL